MDGSDNGKVVEIGDPTKSLLYKVLAHTDEPYMPKDGDKLPDAQLEIIRQWIAANAPEKAGGAVAKKDTGPAVAVVAVEEKPKGPPAMPHDGLLEPFTRTAHRGAVPSVAGSPWAPLVALAAQKQVLLYNTDSLELVGVLPFPEGFPAIVRFSHNGSLLIAGGGVGARLGHVVIWDVVTGRRVTEVGDEFDTVLAADISPDQSLVALGGPSRLVKIFSASDGRMICKMKKHTDWVTALCFTPDGKQLISGDRAGGLAVWDCEGHELQSVSADDGGITGIACQGNIVATSSEDGNVKFWDIVEGKEIKSWHAQDGGVRSIAFTNDGHIVTSGRDHLVRLWDTGGNLVKQFDPLSDIAMGAAAAGGKIIAADWNGLVRVWTPDGKIAGDLDSNPPTLAERIDAANRRLAGLQPIQANTHAAVKRAADALAAAQKQLLAAAAALQAKKSLLATAQARIAPLDKQSAAAAAAIQQAQGAATRLSAAAREIAFASSANPLLRPAALWALAARAAALEAVATGTTALAQAKSALAATHDQCDALGREIGALARSDDAATGVKSAQAALAAAQSAAGKTDGDVKAATLDLAKWRSAAARLTSAAQYASKSDPK
jgi:WD40 repeat protein